MFEKWIHALGRGAQAPSSREDDVVPHIPHGSAAEAVRPLSGGDRSEVGERQRRRGALLEGRQSAARQHQQLQLLICVAAE